MTAAGSRGGAGALAGWAGAHSDSFIWTIVQCTHRRGWSSTCSTLEQHLLDVAQVLEIFCESRFGRPHELGFRGSAIDSDSRPGGGHASGAAQGTVHDSVLLPVRPLAPYHRLGDSDCCQCDHWHRTTGSVTRTEIERRYQPACQWAAATESN